MDKITYGAPRLVDWVAQIKVGAASVSVHFTGGALTSYGVTPAEYTTGNPFIQRVIEQSSYFKEGRIVILRRVAIPGTENVMPKIKNQEADVESQEVNVESQEAGVVKIDVSCLQDAQAYLQEKYNIASYKVRTCESAQKVAMEHGFKFVGAKFDTIGDGEAEF